MLSANRNTPERAGEHFLVLAVAEAKHIFAGGLVCLLDGFAVPGAAAARLIAMGRAEEEITSDFAIPTGAPTPERPRPRASEPPVGSAEAASPWEPLSDDEATGEALLDSLRKEAQSENTPGDTRGPGRPGLN